MTVKGIAQLFKKSVSTIYRWIRIGKLEAKKENGRWNVKPPDNSGEVKWDPQIHRATAEEDGFKPSDFTFMNYPCSDVELVSLPPSEQMSSPIGYRCSVPTDTPQLNRYVEDASDPTGYRKLPDPVGSALSWIEFRLDNADTGAALDTDHRGHENGKVQGEPGRGCRLWKELTPGASINVKLTVFGSFIPYVDKDGGARLQYSNNSNGYVNTPPISTGTHVLSADEDGNIYLDGKQVEE